MARAAESVLNLCLLTLKKGKVRCNRMMGRCMLIVAKSCQGWHFHSPLFLSFLHQGSRKRICPWPLLSFSVLTAESVYCAMASHLAAESLLTELVHFTHTADQFPETKCSTRKLTGKYSLPAVWSCLSNWSLEKNESAYLVYNFLAWYGGKQKYISDDWFFFFVCLFWSGETSVYILYNIYSV